MVVVRAGLTEQKALEALPFIINALNQQRIEEDRRRNKSKLSAQEHQALCENLNNLLRPAHERAFRPGILTGHLERALGTWHLALTARE
jgi:hypothetical protein